MKRSIAGVAERISVSKDVRVRVEGILCDECQEECWLAECWAMDLAGTEAKACVFYRPHIASQGLAVQLLGRWMMSQSGKLLTAESEVWMREHQGSLFEI